LHGEGNGLATASLTLAERLHARRDEIEAAVMTRINAISNPAEVNDPTYADGLRVAVRAALDYGIEGVRGHRHPPPIPPVLLVQARLAARSGVSLDTVLRRYFAGYTLLSDFLVEEVHNGEGGTRGLLQAQATLFDRLLAVVSEEYGRESEHRPATSDQHRAELVDRLLEGEPLDASELRYELEGYHQGVVAIGIGADQALRSLSTALECRLLAVPRGEDVIWAWLGSRYALEPDRLADCLSRTSSGEIPIGLGEPGERLTGWRLTHHQASAAFRVSRRRGQGIVRYGDVALLASTMENELLRTSLRQLYLEPLEGERDGGKAVRETLRAYFDAGQNVSSAAAALKVTRRTITKRLRIAEERIGSQLISAAAEMEMALRLDTFERNEWFSDAI
jgi:hypothetical protein